MRSSKRSKAIPIKPTKNKIRANSSIKAVGKIRQKDMKSCKPVKKRICLSKKNQKACIKCNKFKLPKRVQAPRTSRKRQNLKKYLDAFIMTSINSLLPSCVSYVN